MPNILNMKDFDLRKYLAENKLLKEEHPDHTHGLTIKGRGFDWRKPSKKENITPSDILTTLVGDGYGKDENDIRQKLENQYGENIPGDSLLNFIERLIKAFPPESDNPVDDLKYIVNSIRQGNKNDLKGFFNEI